MTVINALIISPQLRKANKFGLKLIAKQWPNSDDMRWLIGRENAFRARWRLDDEGAEGEIAEEQKELLACWRTRADACGRADTPQGCQGCPYSAGDFEQVLPGWLRFEGMCEDEFHNVRVDVRIKEGHSWYVYLNCWRVGQSFQTAGGCVIQAAEILHYRLSKPL